MFQLLRDLWAMLFSRRRYTFTEEILCEDEAGNQSWEPCEVKDGRIIWRGKPLD